MEKKVCHFTSVHNRYDTRIFFKECVSLAKNGYDVILLVNDNDPDEIVEGVKIVSTKMDIKTRKQRFFDSHRVLKKKLIELDADIYHFHDPDLLFIGRMLKKIGKKVIFDSHEYVVADIRNKEYLSLLVRVVASNAYRVLQTICARKFDALVSVTPAICRELEKINKKTVQVTNYPIFEESEEIETVDWTKVIFAGGVSELWSH